MNESPPLPVSLHTLLRSALLLFGLLSCASALAFTRTNAIALYGEPHYKAGAASFDFADPNARVGGTLTLPAFGAFDSLNAYAVKGLSLSMAADQRIWNLDMLNETLMAGSSGYLLSPDEPQSAYCLVCNYLEFDESYQWVTFGIDPRARFHDGSPITAHDVVASFRLLTQDGAHPRYFDMYRDILRVEATSNYRVTFYAKPGAGRQLLFKLGELPVMSAAFWKDRPFSDSLRVPPLLSGPYRVCRVDFGHRIELCRVENFWSRNKFFYRRQYNFERIRYEFFRDRTVAFESFKSGKLSAWVEYVAKNWATGYNFPAQRSGLVIKETIPNSLPANYQFFALNLRRAPFSDLNFRKALTLAFDFEWTNRYLFNSAYRRSTTYFPNTNYGARGAPSPAERDLLLSAGVEPDHEMLSTPFELPKTDGSGNPRPQLKMALALLKASGYHLKNSQLYTQTGKAVWIEFLVDHPSMTRVVLPFIRNLKKIGIGATVRTVDEAQYKARMDHFNYDVTVTSFAQAQIPSYELRSYFHSSQANTQGSYNYSGIRNPVLDHLLERLAVAQSLEEIHTITAAMDRVLLWNYYTVPQWYLGSFRIAHWARLQRPATTPPLSLGFPGWWIAP
ncbi:ABC-type transport system, periplasmic component [gamma proteobacterium HdN1]|nr:ABC-type transport system, periplasmic component [gamma proteobacterium HdN1]